MTKARRITSTWRPRSRLTGRGLLVGVAAIVALWSGEASATKTFYIDQAINYDSSTCNPNTTPEETYSLRTAMIADSWTGYRYVDQNAWPQDFREACSTTYGANGYDSTYADGMTFVAFSGHGGPGGIRFSYPHLGECDHSFQSNGRLGSMAGASATIGMWLTCETLKESELPNGPNWQWLRQQLGFDGDIWLGADNARNVYQATGSSGKSNSQAWLDEMNQGSWHPLAVTYSNSSVSDCWYVHNNAKMKADIYNYPRTSGPSCGNGQPLFYYCWQKL